MGCDAPGVRVEGVIEGGELVVKASVSISQAGISQSEALDLCYVATGVAAHELLDRLSGGWAGIRFPREYVVGREVVGSARARVEGGEALIEVRLSCSIAGARSPCSDGGEEFMRLLKHYLIRVFSNSRIECCLKFGSALTGRGERVEVRLARGGRVIGDVMGYGFKGELMLVSEDGRVRLLRPSEVVGIKVLWP